MHFTFLGTSAGSPTKQRNVSGLALGPEQGKAWLLIDCGEGTQHRIQHAPVSLGQLELICITHVHGDHCYGLPGLIASAALAGRQRPLSICAPRGVREFVEAAIRFTDMHLDFELHFIEVAEAGPVLSASFADISAIRLSHCVESYAYKIRERLLRNPLDKDKLEALGVVRGPLWGELAHGRDIQLSGGRVVAASEVRLGSARPRVIIVGGDNQQPELLLEALAEAQVLIHEATFTESVLQEINQGKERNITHSSARRVAEVAQQARLPHLILTHFSPRFTLGNRDPDLSLAALEAEARSVYQGQLYMAEDLASYRLDKLGQLSLEPAPSSAMGC